MARAMDDAVQRLLEQAQAGNRDALSGLLLVHVGYVAYAAHHQAAAFSKFHPAEADVVQQTLLEAYCDFHSFAGRDLHEFKGWLRQIVSRNLIDEQRHWLAEKRTLRRHKYLEEMRWPGVQLRQLSTSDEDTPSAIYRRDERAAAVQSAIDHLPDDQRTVVVLRHLRGAGFPEIARQVHRSEVAARSLWARALQRLSQKMRGIV